MAAPGNSFGTSQIVVRGCDAKDMREVTEIYRDHVLNSAATFEIDPPSDEEMMRRRTAILEGGYVYLVAEKDGEVVGYAYTSLYRARPAYRFTIENSVYVRSGYERRGIGRLLMERLLGECEKRPFRQVIAVIGDSANKASIELHRTLGFCMIGTHPAVGFKFGRWLDSVLMQKDIGLGDRTKPDQRSIETP